MIEIKNLSFRYSTQQNWLIKDFSFKADPGSIIKIAGNSGSGKTTLLNILCNVIPSKIEGDLQGDIFFESENIKTLELPMIAPKISMLMQESDLQLFFPTVEQELAFAPENLKIPPKEIKATLEKILEKLNIAKIRNKNINTLSFGQKKLVALGSLLTLSPKLFLLDEPTVGLSNYNANIIKNIMLELKKDDKIIFFTDHSLSLQDLADDKIQLEDIR